MNMQRHYLLAAILIASVAKVEARLKEGWTFEQLTQKADLIVIATPTSTKKTSERTILPNVKSVGKDGKERNVIGQGVETRFAVLGVLKGDQATKTFILHHYWEKDWQFAINGLGLVEFTPEDSKRYLMFLLREPDGRFRSVSPQVDPADSIMELGCGGEVIARFRGPEPPLPANEE